MPDAAPVPGTPKAPEGAHPALLAILADTRGGELSAKLGIEYLELSAEYSVARMPVEGNRQIMGLLHGGAHLVLGESLGSISASIHGAPDRIAVGIEISASHTRSVASGWVTGTCRAISLGRTLCTHEIVVTDESGERLSTIRMTNYLKARRD